MEASALSAPAGLHRTSVTSRLLPLRSDDQLVALFRAGDDDAFRAIHDRYRQRLFSYARQMLGGSRSDAEDVLQDVFLRAYRALRADQRPISLRAWLYRVAHNRCVDHLRRPVPAPSDVFQVSRSPLHDPLAEAEQREELQRLVQDVRRLPDQQRSALLMREMDGMSYAELAEALDTSVPAVKSLLVRARIGLVEAIEARDADCADIRHDLAASYDRGVRASGKARRHLRDCGPCTVYRAQLREVRQGFASLSPGPAPVNIFAKLLGLGSAGSGAASGGAVVGGGAAAVSATKVAAVVCCAAALTGGAASEVKQFVAPTHPARAQHRHATVRPTVAPALDRGPAQATAPRVLLVPAGHLPRARHAVPADGLSVDLAPIRPDERRLAARHDGTTGGQAGPDEPATTTDPAPDDPPAAGDPITTLIGSAGSTTGTNDTGSGSATAPSSSSTGAGTTGTGSGTSQPTAGSSSSSSPSSTGSDRAPARPRRRAPARRPPRSRVRRRPAVSFSAIARYLASLDHEELLVRRGRRSGMFTMVAVHSTVRGPALGGCRMWRYDDSRAALRDVLRLSRAMTFKSAVAGLPLGGGKGVIMLPLGGVVPRGRAREDILRDFGDTVEVLAGHYITAEDVGTSSKDMQVIAGRTPHVTGLSRRRGGSGDPSPYTALGVQAAIAASCERAFGSPSLRGRTVCVSGLGHVGMRLAKGLLRAGAKVLATDIDPAKRDPLKAAGGRWIPTTQALSQAADVFAPCALGGVLTHETVGELQAPVVAGAANNQLADDAVGELLAGRGILWAPDFVANAGGIINIAVELEREGYDPVRARERVRGIADTMRRIYDDAERTGATPLAAAMELARLRLREAA